MSSLEANIGRFGPARRYNDSATLMSEAREFFINRVYGIMPEDPPERRLDLLEEGLIIDPKTGEEKGFRRQLLVTLSRAGNSIHVPVLIQASSRQGPFKTIVSPNFWGNHSVTTDAATIENLDTVYNTNFPRYKVDFREEHRGWKRNQFDMERIIAPRVVDGAVHEYAAVTFCYNDIVPDREAEDTEGAYVLYPELMGKRNSPRALSMGGWGILNVALAASEDPLIAPDRMGVMAFSRLAKAEHLLLTHDHPFKAACSVASGKGAAGGLKNGSGEPSAFMGSTRSQWFTPDFLGDVMVPGRLPFGFKYMLAHPRVPPLLVSVDQADWWSAPEKQRRAVKSANQILERQGRKPTIEFVTHSAGGHTVSPHWEEQYLPFFDRNL